MYRVSYTVHYPDQKCTIYIYMYIYVYIYIYSILYRLLSRRTNVLYIYIYIYIVQLLCLLLLFVGLDNKQYKMHGTCIQGY
jgi:hypothetical protein